MRLLVGRIGRAHGIRGEVVVDVRTDSPQQRFAAGSELATDPESAGPLTVAATRAHAGRLLLRFDSVHDRDAAEALLGVTLLVDSHDLAPCDDPDEFHDHELIGLRAVTTDGVDIGVVDDVLHHGQDLLVVQGGAGASILVPFVRALVPEIDAATGRLVVDPPPGLLDLDR